MSNLKRRGSRLLFWAITLVGTLVFCDYSRSWQDLRHVVYDVTAGLAVFSFVAQVIVSGLSGKRDALWWVRLGLLIPLSVVPVVRAVLGWRISGHLTDILIVAGVQTVDQSLSQLVKLLYWVSVALALWLRWCYFDVGGHVETYAAFAVAAICLVAATAVYRILRARVQNRCPS